MPNIIGGKYKKTKIEVPNKIVRPTSSFKREAIFSILAIRDKVAPPTINLEQPSEGCDLNYSANTASEHKISKILSNSFGFGGTNATLAFSELE